MNPEAAADVRRPDRFRVLASAVAPTLAVAATYVFFLLFAQYGLVRLLGERLGSGAQSATTDPSAAVQLAMAAMGLSGLLGSFAIARWLRNHAPLTGVRAGFAICCLTGVAAPWCHSTPAFVVLSIGIGAGLSTLTVSLASGLRDWSSAASSVDGGGRPRSGLQIGLGTGMAYWLCNLPATFEGTPSHQCWISATAALLGLAASFALPLEPTGHLDRRADTADDVGARFRYGTAVLCGAAVLGFLALIWLDSAAFNVIQQTEQLKGATWSGAQNKMAMGAAHLLAAILAGVWIDRGRYGVLQLTAFGCFLVSFTLLQHPGSPPWWAGPLYAVGISIYSTALVAFPGLAPDAPELVPIRWRAAGVYGVGGWLGSALGVGMAQNLHGIPTAFLWAAGLLLAVGTLLNLGARLRRAPSGPLTAALVGGAGALALHGLTLASAASPPHEDPLALLARGRQIYIAEGCVNCHSQFLRPTRPGADHDVVWWGPMRAFDRSEGPPLPGNRRQGPDLKNAGNRRSRQWHRQHLIDPRSVSPGSRMPSYRHLFEIADGADSAAPSRGDVLVAYLDSLGADSRIERHEIAQHTTISLDSGRAERGVELFRLYCTACHGDRALGDGELSDLRFGPVTGRGMNLRKPDYWLVTWGDGQGTLEQGLARLVRFGLPGTSMPGHEWLADQQLADLVAYLSTLPGTDPEWSDSDGLEPMTDLPSADLTSSTVAGSTRRGDRQPAKVAP